MTGCRIRRFAGIATEAPALSSLMPYEWLPSSGSEVRVRLWPYRSLGRRGFAGFIGVTALLISVPLLSLIGTTALWVLLPFLVAAVAGVFVALRASYRSADLCEDLTLTPTRISLTRTGPRGRVQEWDGNVHWLRATLHKTGGPVPNYLTLKAEGREVELGAFLSEEERIALASELRGRIARA